MTADGPTLDPSMRWLIMSAARQYGILIYHSGSLGRPLEKHKQGPDRVGSSCRTQINYPRAECWDPVQGTVKSGCSWTLQPRSAPIKQTDRSTPFTLIGPHGNMNTHKNTNHNWLQNLVSYWKSASQQQISPPGWATHLFICWFKRNSKSTNHRASN